MGGGHQLDEHITIDVLAGDRDPEAERQELRRLLSDRPRQIPSHYFYDGTGSSLFDRITRLPEYYLTRTEAAILERNAARIVRRSGAHELVELGSGTSTKTRILLDAMAEAGTLQRYLPFDVSEPVVRDAIAALAARYPELGIHAVVGDFFLHLDQIPDRIQPGNRRLVLLIGSTIGNFEAPEATALIRRIAQTMQTGDSFLLGVDLVKDESVLHAAYNDTEGITARFNLNVLDVLNFRFGGDFSTCLFEHRAFYDRARERIEMRLVALRDQRVRLTGLDLELEIEAGEEILTEISCKYRREVVVDLLSAGGFELTDWLTDDDRLFGLALARRS